MGAHEIIVGMMEKIMISSVTNQKVKDVRKLQKSSKQRNVDHKFVIEGWRLLSEVPQENIDIIYVLEEEVEKLATYVDTTAVEVEMAKASVLKAMSQEKTPQGVISVVNMKRKNEVEIRRTGALIIALECVQDPGNLGTILRTADAAGVDCVILSKGTVDMYNPKVIKATMGAIFRLDILTNVDLIEYISELKDRDIAVYAAHLEAKRHYFECDYKKATCFLMGNEGNGLSEEIAKLATDTIKIPMREEAESLNVAVATSILTYEAVRQRLI